MSEPASITPTAPMPTDEATKFAIQSLAYQALTSRRVALDNLMWQAPVLSLTAQAFLLTIALGPGSSRVGRFIASLLGVLVAAISIQLISKHRYHERRDSILLRKLEDKMEFKKEVGYLPHDYEESLKSAELRPGLLAVGKSYRWWVFGLACFFVASGFILVSTVINPDLFIK